MIAGWTLLSRLVLCFWLSLGVVHAAAESVSVDYGKIPTIHLMKGMSEVGIRSDIRAVTSLAEEDDALTVRKILLDPSLATADYKVISFNQLKRLEGDPRAVWVRLSIVNEFDDQVDTQYLVWEMSGLLGEEVEVFQISRVNDALVVDKKIIYSSEMRLRSEYSRPTFNVHLSPGGTSEILVKLTSPSSMRTDPVATLWTYGDFSKNQQVASSFESIFIGFVISVSVLCLLFAATLREAAYLYFSLSCFSLSVCCYHLIGNNTLFEGLSWFSSVRLIGDASAVSSAVFALMVSYRFLKATLVDFSGQAIVQGLVGAGTVLFFATIFGLDIRSGVVLFVLASMSVALAYSVFCWVSGYQSAILFVVGWVFLVGSAFQYVISASGYGVSVELSNNVFVGGVALGVICTLSGVMSTFYVDRQGHLSVLKEKHETSMRLKQAEARLVHRALHSRSTGLPNRMLLVSKIESLIAESSGQQSEFALVLVGFEDFGEINYTFGADNGDRILVSLANRLGDLINGEEGVIEVDDNAAGKNSIMSVVDGVIFAILVSVDDLSYLDQMARRIVDAMNAPLEFDQLFLDIRSLVGICVWDGRFSDSGSFLRRSKIALEMARNNPKRVEFYSNDIDPYDPAKLTILGELRKAIDNDELELHYQPQVSSETGRLMGVEAFVRWDHPVRGHLKPESFVFLAERAGVIHSLTLWVLRRSIRDLRVMIDEGLDVSLSVNASSRNVRQSKFVKDLLGICGKHDVSPGRVDLDLSEADIMSNPDEIAQVFVDLKREGVGIAIDDFGTGCSSLARLKELAISQIKIDTSFVVNLPDNKKDRVLVEAMIEMGSAMGVDIVAEGVESSRALEYLASAGCQLVQGFCVAKPMILDDLIEWARRYSPEG